MAVLTLGNGVHHDGLFLANACSASYAKNPSMTSAFKRTDLADLTTFGDGDVHDDGDAGFVARSSGGTVVALRGTNDALDWLSNLNFNLVAAMGGKVHEGFLKGCSSIEKAALQAVQLLAIDDSPIYVAGHSRGAAIAVLLAKKLKAKLPNAEVMVYGFGSPRVGNMGFYNNYELRDQTHLYINNADPVVLSPPMQMDFVHTTEQTLILNGKLLRIDIDMPIDFGAHLIRLSLTQNRVKDHDINDSYITNLEKILSS